MNDIDWSKAPEGATHWEPDGYAVPSWMKFEDGKWFYWPPNAVEPSWYFVEEVIQARIARMIPVPTELRRPAAWTGQGLPPVGTVCEVCDADGNWHSCRVLAHYLEDAVFVPDPDYPYGVYDGLPIGRFRPIRTPDQIAAEEREKAIDEMYGLTRTSSSQEVIYAQRQVCEDLYDAGLRFKEAP